MKKLNLLLGIFGFTLFTLPNAHAFECTGRPYCKDMSSCAEAKYQMNVCGYHKLDRDNDGIPCENVCGKGSGKKIKKTQKGNGKGKKSSHTKNKKKKK
ncbi:hypothetical protein A4G19_08405 [Pasteurellaceae bacterium Macca]|nr:hypothetical protein [Pasteurellaceae bacterium Macca]